MKLDVKNYLNRKVVEKASGLIKQKVFQNPANSSYSSHLQKPRKLCIKSGGGQLAHGTLPDWGLRFW